mmetsp:Transcript_16096/g.36847  ORF Transcript_16096/g.36847 Transcript_16096/m.36847 type:complete len:296 (+) Transcript_16096:63-950(+)
MVESPASLLAWRRRVHHENLMCIAPLRHVLLQSGFQPLIDAPRLPLGSGLSGLCAPASAVSWTSDDETPIWQCRPSDERNVIPWAGQGARPPSHWVDVKSATQMQREQLQKQIIMEQKKLHMAEEEAARLRARKSRRRPHSESRSARARTPVQTDPPAANTAAAAAVDAARNWKLGGHMQPSVDPSAVTTAMSSLSDVSKLHPSRPDTVGILKASLLDIPRAAAQTPKRPQSARSALSGPGSSVASVQRARKTPESRPRSANHTGVPRLSPATPRAGRSRPASAAVSARSSGPRD